MISQGDWDTSPDRHAYEVWICGSCDSHLLDQNAGGHRCETCGDLYDHRGNLLPDEDES